MSLLNDNMDRVVEKGTFKILVGGVSPQYIAKDRIKKIVWDMRMHKKRSICYVRV